jgi:endonuclease/exonuclease/phosphatase family metal-dependent hydrolase
MKMKLRLLFAVPLALAAVLSCTCTKSPEVNKVWNKDDETKEEVTPEGDGSALLVGSFNIRYYNTTDEYPWSARKDAAIKFIKETKPDFLGLQELRSTQSQDISYNLSESYGYYDINRDTGQGISGGSGEGVGILYRKDRFALQDKGFFWLAEDPDKLPSKNADGTYSSWNSACRRVVVWVKVTDKLHNNQTVYFFATHFDHKSSAARLNSSELTIKKIKEITKVSDLSKSGCPIFLVADFNCTVGSDELAPLRTSMNEARKTAKSTESGITFNGFGSGNSVIDHIFYVGNVNADKYHVVTENYGVKYISDHYPVTLQCSYK